MQPSRRSFLAASLALAAPAAAIEPFPRPGKPRLRLSLAAYSFREALDISKKPPAMTLEDFADFAAEHGCDAVEPTAYYFADTSPARLAKLKLHCARLGLDISGTAVGNDFCHTDADALKKQIRHVKDWSERAAIMGAKTMRIFAGAVKKDDAEVKAIARCVAAIEECCEHAAKHGVILALENHGGLTETAGQMLALVKAVKHPAFGVNLDTGNFHSEDPYAELAQLAPYAVTVQVKTEIRRKGKKAEDAELAKVVGILKDAKYSGYVALEHEAKEDPKTAIPLHLAALRKLIG